MKIYNSLTRQKDEFVPLRDRKVGMYVCGPTVYDEPHIGHARSAYIFDVIRRYLTHAGFAVTFVRNVTDVDDKIIDKARVIVEKQPRPADLGATTREVASANLAAYHADMAAVGIAEPDREPKATEYIGKMQDFIQRLIDRGAAYCSSGDVYFDIRKAKDYGKLSNQSIDNMEIGARIAPGEKKKDPLDFALWKAAKEGEPSWPSPWGPGRPGWHIECSVMSSDILGGEFDIHGGGIDLIFPHHENEIAQSEGAGQRFARFWVHNGLLTISGEKMAKSLGNFISIKEFIRRYTDTDLLKLLFLGTHYRHPVDYTDEKIAEARRQKERIMIFVKKVDDLDRGTPRAQGTADPDPAFLDEFRKAMDDDFNTPSALAVMFRCVSTGNEIMDDARAQKDRLKRLRDFIVSTGQAVFGLTLMSDKNVDTDILGLIAERDKARQIKDFKKADQLRQALSKKGIILEDTKDGTVWRRKL